MEHFVFMPLDHDSLRDIGDMLYMWDFNTLKSHNSDIINWLNQYNWSFYPVLNVERYEEDECRSVIKDSYAYYDIRFEFETLEDAMLFKLRWL